jgi:hypothetical protein
MTGFRSFFNLDAGGTDPQATSSRSPPARPMR